jgi:thiosulfate dehydrogenase (quinone) large subunit
MEEQHTPYTVRQPPGCNSAQEGVAGGIVSSWRHQPSSMIILRAFLGVTFVYAGIQKLADPGYLTPGAPTSFGAQVSGFARGSPIGFLLDHLAEHAFAFGIGVAVAEIVIGLATLAGFFSSLAALGGFAISVALWLSATWHSHPYFTGADSIYAVAWAAYGAHLVTVIRQRQPVRRAGRTDGSRRAMLRASVIGGGTLVLAGIARAADAFVPRPATSSPDRLASTSSSPAGTTQKPHSEQHNKPTRSRPQGREIASLDQLQIGSPVAFTGPGSTPGVLLRLSTDRVVAYSRVCTHAGCIVGYDSGANLLVCPCHGAEFDPTKGAQVVGGPAPTPLKRIPVTVDRSTQKVYLTA